jgi:predicted molibdopterin-dependent oxidoreductase YjgC
MVMKSNNIDLFESYGDRKLAGEMMNAGLLNGAAGPDDIQKADTILAVETDASITHPLAEHKLRKAFHEGKTVIFAGPSPTRTSYFATREFIYSPGGSYAFLYRLATGLAGREETEQELRDIIALLDGSKKLMILAGDDLLREERGRMVLGALHSIYRLKNRKAKCSLRILGQEGNQASAILSGVHPDYLPGFRSLSDQASLDMWNRAWDTSLRKTRGLAYQDMTGDISDAGLKSLLVVGDIPVHKSYRNLDFMVQLNMYSTPLTAYTDVLLPVSSFLENEGHFPGMDGKPSRLKRVISEPGNARSVSRILAELATAMKEKGFGNGNTASVWKEMREYGVMEQTLPDMANAKPAELKPAPVSHAKGKKHRTAKVQHHYRYRGNDLAEYIPELKEIL